MQEYWGARRRIPLRPGVNGQNPLVIGFELAGHAVEDCIDHLCRQ